MKKISKIFISLLVVFLVLQLVRPKEVYESLPQKDLTGLPKEVSDVLRNSCFDCHSSEVNLKWFDKVTPANFLVSSHIKEGREALNFSKWDSLTKAQQDAAVFYALNNMLTGNMPLKSYVALHPSTKVNSTDIAVLKNYALSVSSLNAVAPVPNKKSAEFTTIENPGRLPVKTSLNGLTYIPDYRTWKAISTTDRFDNGTIRIIYGNDVAVRAIQERRNNPWPDGTAFAKAAWKQKIMSDGSTTTGDFVQVEFMVKNAEKYKNTAGWGWGRWKGNDLKPYGKAPNFDMECVYCHRPMEHRDYVFTSPIHLLNSTSKKH